MGWGSVGGWTGKGMKTGLFKNKKVIIINVCQADNHTIMNTPDPTSMLYIYFFNFGLFCSCSCTSVSPGPVLQVSPSTSAWYAQESRASSFCLKRWCHLWHSSPLHNILMEWNGVTGEGAYSHFMWITQPPKQHTLHRHHQFLDNKTSLESDEAWPTIKGKES